MVKQIVSAAGGSAGYPTTVSGGYECRNMKAAHANLHIGGGLFDKFTAIAISVADNAGLSSNDLVTMRGFFSLQKADVVDENAPDGGFFISDGG
jgi:hypothetical protein